jgi:DNA-binding XRE family transcriptional regulator
MRRARRANGLTQVELAEAIGVPQPTIARLENETHEPSLRIALLLAAELATTVEALFGGPEIEERRARAVRTRARMTPGGESMQQATVPTFGWNRAIADEDHKGEHAGRLVADTDEGPISISANVKVNGPRAGLRRIHTQNPNGTWTSVVIDARGALVGYAHARTKKEAREQLNAQDPHSDPDA